ncbi:hypothetical protein E1A91_D01G175400v1 [Gossypium mustelinum]|uniref:Uncharacterized protein n=1 Tax=Gossypium mustelinum TaxID=34275 RepID=A0A5D2WAL6_GOSMU|nr:hypothetical protein E1A91_D01G175400v1 [Gossypium mustelinum]
MKGREKWCFTSKPGQKLAITIWLHRRYMFIGREEESKVL